MFSYVWPSKRSFWYIETRQEVARPPPPRRQGHVLCVWLGISWPARPLISHIATLSVFPLPHQLMGRALLQCALLWKMSHTKSRLLLREMNEPPMFIFVVQPDYKLKVANINFCFKCRHPSFEWFIVIIVDALFREFTCEESACVNARVMMAGVYNVVLIYDSIYRWLACDDWWVWTRELTTSLTSAPMPTSVSLAVSSSNLRLLFTQAV